MTSPRRPATVEAIARDGSSATGRVRISGVDEPAEVERIEEGRYRISLGDRRFEVVVARQPGVEWGWVDGRAFRWTRTPEAAARDPEPAADAGAVRAPMPAVVTAVAVSPGEAVARGDTLLVLEAMKMELPVKAPRAAVVTAVRCAAGDRVDADASLVELDTGDSVQAERPGSE